ncbi:MAG: hypothetical protein EZS28_048615, partial [Streblomastix strix]
MYVIKKETRTFKPDLKNLKEDFLLGIKCRWFTTTGELQEAIFSTKDIQKVEKLRWPEEQLIQYKSMDQIQQLIQAVVGGDQAAMQQFQQLLQDPQQGPQVIKALQTLAQQGDQGAQQLLQMLQQGGGGQQAPAGGGQPMAAKLGGKLRTVKALNNICPEGFELKSFKAGGTLCKKCMKKAEDGAKIDKKPSSVAEEFKQAKGKKEPKPNTAKKQLGGTLVTPQAVEKFKAYKQGGLFNKKVVLRTKNKQQDKIRIDEPGLLFTKEFEILFNRDETGSYKERAFREFKYIFLMLDWRSPYADYNEHDRHNSAREDSRLTEEEWQDLSFRAACR